MHVEVTAEAMADIAVAMVDMDMLSGDMPERDMLGVDMLPVDGLTIFPVPRAAMRALQVAGIIGMAAATGEAVTGIHPMGILGSDTTVWAMAIHITELAITVTPVGTMVRITGTTLTATDTGRI
jgi:hypothetical protein